LSDSLFRRDGDLLVPTKLTEGPWSPDAQHGGPPAALLAGAIESAASDGDMVVARLTIELLRPVPLEPLTIATEVLRPGKKVQLVSSSLYHDGQKVAQALGLKIRAKQIDFRHEVADPVSIPSPDQGRPANFFDKPGAFASEAVEIRMLEGDFAEPGPGRAWIRLLVPLVEGEETTAVQRVTAAADFGNGVGNLVGRTRSWIFINPDLTIRLARPPIGEWFLLDSATRIHDTGTGLASSRLADERGWLGEAAQSLLVDTIE
jgi:hypothetical protein